MRSKMIFFALTLTIGLATGAQAEYRSPDCTTADGKWIQRAPDYADASGRDWLFHHDIPEKRNEGEPVADPGVDLF